MPYLEVEQCPASSIGIIGNDAEADVIAGGFFGSKRPDGSLEVELQAILGSTNELGFTKIGAYTI